MCAKYIDPSTGIRAICDCAPGFYGIDFCEPVADFIRLPPFFSVLAGAHLKHPALLNGVYDETNINATEHQFPGDQVLSIPLNNSLIPIGSASTNVRVPTYVVYSAFKVVNNEDDSVYGDLALATPSKDISINTSIN